MSDETTPGQFDAINKRLDAGDDRMGRIEDSLKKNTEATERIERSTAGLLEWLNAFEGTFKVLNGIAKLAKPVGVLAGAVAAVMGLWFAFRGHR